MEINGFSELQAQIADQMWECETNEEVNNLVRQYGRDAITVYEMIIAAYTDENCTDLAQAQAIIESIKPQQ